MWRLNDLFGVNQAHQAERLACIAFDHLDEIAAGTPSLLARNRALFNDFVAAPRRYRLARRRPHGITAFPRWRGGDTERLARTCCATEYDTSIVPGRWFEMPDHFRVGFGGRPTIVEEGLDRLGAALDDSR